MCDYSLHNVMTRKAAIGDKLMTTKFPSGTGGLCDINDPRVAVCLMPGTELAFAQQVTRAGLFGIAFTTARLGRFRQINTDVAHTHHDAVEFADGKVLLLHAMSACQFVTVLQLPAKADGESTLVDQVEDRLITPAEASEMVPIPMPRRRVVEYVPLVALVALPGFLSAMTVAMLRGLGVL
jgi:hypothetical protein